MKGFEAKIGLLVMLVTVIVIEVHGRVNPITTLFYVGCLYGFAVVIDRIVMGGKE
jgi:hypothetical protein